MKTCSDCYYHDNCVTHAIRNVPPDMSCFTVEKHIFVTPQDSSVSFPDDRFCERCGKYFTDEIHQR